MQKSFCNLMGHPDCSASPGLIACLLILGGILCIHIPAALTQSLSLDSQRGAVGDTVAVTIRLDSVPNAVEAFGFDVIYDSNVLRYTGVFTQGDTVSNFDFFNVSAPGQGQARVGGFTTKQRIEPGQSGQLVTLEFEVRRAGQTNLSVARLVDDMAGWSALASHFESMTPVEPTRQSEDADLRSVPSRSEEPTAPPPAPRPAKRALRLPLSPSPSSPVTGGAGRVSQPRTRQTEQPMKQAQTARPESDTPRETTPSAKRRSVGVKTTPDVSPSKELSVVPAAPPSTAPLTETPPAVSTPVRVPSPVLAPTQPGTTIKTSAKEITGGHFRFLRTTVPIVALFLLGCVIVALLSLKGRS